MELIKKAQEFARQAHESIDQRRKYTNEPYIVHPAAVASIVAEVSQDEAMICAAWLHDVVEDTPFSIEDITREFGDRVAELVADLTDISTLADGNRRARKLKDLEHTKAACPEAKTVKLADLIHNSSCILKNDPGFARTYMDEKRQLLEVLKEGDATLYARADAILQQYYQEHPKRSKN